MNETLHATLSTWSNFYLITGTAAAALTGLQFVVQTLLASDSLRPVTGRDPEAGIATFGTPTVVHFALALLISAVICAPWTAFDGLRVTLGILGAGAMVYSIIVLRRARRQRVYTPAFEDWLWHVVLPAIAYASVLVSSVVLHRGMERTLFVVPGATLLLLCIGIHKAWDTVTWLNISAFRAESTTATVAAKETERAVAASESIVANIRPATHDDLPKIGRLGAMLVRAHHDFDPQRFIPATPDTPQGYASFLSTQLDRPDLVTLVAEADGELLGYSYAGVEGTDYMSLRGPAGILYDIVVDPAYRGRGVGRQLLDATLSALEARGAPRVLLSTAEQNESAQRLFDRAGFRRTMREMTRELKQPN